MRLLHGLLIQAMAAVLVWVFVAPGAQPWLWAGLAGLLAIGLACCGRRRGWSCLLHGLPWPLLIGMRYLSLPPFVYLAAFALTLAFSRNAWLSRVPFYRSSAEVAAALAAVLAPGARLLEAGSGDGRLALRLAALRPDVQVLALENAWGSFAAAKLRWWFAGKPGNVQLQPTDFWRASWCEFDAVYVFLSPAPMKKVWDKFQMQAKPGAVLISNTFAVPDVTPAQTVALNGRLQQSLLFWRVAHGTE